MGKRNLFITAFLYILTLSMQAQENYYGKVVDNKQQPISFANVALLNANDSSFVTGVTTDEEGKFNLSKVSKGLLKLNSSSKCNGIHINNLFKFFVWCEVSKSFTRSII